MGQGCHHQPTKGAAASGPWAGGMLSLPSVHPQLLAVAVVFLCVNLTGAFHKHQMQDASRDLFTYTVKCIQIRRKLRIEKRQQVGTLPPARATARPLPSPPWLSPRPHALCPFSLDVSCLLSSVCVGCRARLSCRPHPGVLGTRSVWAWLGWWQGIGQQRWRVLRAEQAGGWRRQGRVGQAWGLTLRCLPRAAQENLLLSVLPAHISMGMKLAIIEKLKERGDRRCVPDNNFHSLYVKRHQNVR